MRIGWLVVVMVGVMTGMVWGNRDLVAPLVRIEKTFDTPNKQLGQVKVVYVAEKGETKATLKVECDLFKKEVDADKLEGLSGADWGKMMLVYSDWSFDEKLELVDRPYVYVDVPWRRQVGTEWEQAWVQYHFDDKGKCVRHIK